MKPTGLNSTLLCSPASLSAYLRCSTHHVSSRKLTTPASAPKPFKDMPGPKGYPLIGTALDYRNDRYTTGRVVKRRFDEYGHIYREKMIPVFQAEQVILCDPKAMETVFRAEGEWPQRIGTELFERVTKDAGIANTGIFLALSQEQWQKLRYPTSKFMMIPRKVAEYHEGFNNITLDLLKSIEMKKDPHTSELTDVPSHFFNWSFESVAFFAFGKRLGCLDPNGVPPESQEFIAAVSKFFVDNTNLIFSLPLYNYFRTKKWKEVVKGLQTVYSLASRFVEEKLAKIEEEQSKALEAAASGEEKAPETVDFITYMVHSGKMSIEDVTATCFDMLSAGVETTSYTLCWMLYLLANNPKAQEKLRNEIQSVVGSDQIVTPAHISEMSYLRGVLKETQRLYPGSSSILRTLQEDVVLSGYSVPKGVLVIMPSVIGRLPDLYPEPDEFRPERWSKENKDKLPSSFAHLPFGFGTRMCVGRRLAELEMFIAISQLIREYKVEYLDKEPMGYIQNLFTKPDRQLNLTFQKL